MFNNEIVKAFLKFNPAQLGYVQRAASNTISGGCFFEGNDSVGDALDLCIAIGSNGSVIQEEDGAFSSPEELF